MWETSKNKKIADRLFYGIVSLLVVVLGTLGIFIIHRQMGDAERDMTRKVEMESNHLEHVLSSPASHLNAKKMRKLLEEVPFDELQAVKIFDAENELVYVYERSNGRAVYDREVERNLVVGGRDVGKMNAYFSGARVVRAMAARQFLHLVILISAAGMGLGGGLYFLVRKFVLRPIETTLNFSNGLAGGNYSERINIVSNDEMGMLQRSLNSMADALQDSLENLKAAFYEAEGARVEALEASRLKSEFLANMSHEIRTPINAIVGFADVLLEDEGDVERRENLKTIKKSAGILLENISEILDFSKIEAGKMKLARSEFLLCDLIEEVAPIVKLRLHGKDVRFQSTINEALEELPVAADRVRLRQVLLNVLINAAKFTNKGKIELSIEPSPNGSQEIIFKVADTGIGIPKGEQGRVFEPFMQADGGITREYGGTGLGLAIARRLVEMMGGRIWFESNPNLGSTFWFFVKHP
ncbi:MAG: hypothetical protein A3I09_01585 [Deltaproteobacteria bacterium RIFCSPLOWO2_02_FULL_47_10]|nr:MAG: hypothetical protein A3I09_01585 [Deltaproteobacteria bacterium RIFCSPLOWO2_02_FULL_47_10]